MMDFDASDMECNIPELLARDLEISQLVFMSKHMTAGAPSLDIAEDRDSFDRCQSLAVDIERSGRRSLSHRPITRVRSSGVLGQRYSEEEGSWLGFVSSVKSSSWDGESGSRESLGDGEASSDDVASESSVDVEPPPFRHRQYSVATPATSVTSARCSSSLSHKRFSGFSGAVNDHSGSWLDFEPEIVIPPDNRRSVEMDASAQRPHTSSGLSTKDLNRLSQTSVGSIPVPKRRSSLSHRVTILSEDGSQIGQLEDEPAFDFSKEGRLSNSQTCPQLRTSAASSGDNMANVKVVRVQSPPQKPVIIKLSRPSQESERPTVAHLDDQASMDDRANGHVASLPTSPSYHAKPHAAIQSWLDSSTDSPFTPSMASDVAECEELGRGVPIPLQVVDSLQTSIRGFPHTLLTTSSLSIETIRTYSHKLKVPTSSSQGRYPTTQAFPILPISSTSSPKQHRFKLSRLLTSRRALHDATRATFVGRSSSSPSRHTKPNPFHHRASFASTVPTAAFARLKCIFPDGADYLCDALYAHILAYNYLCSVASSCGPVFAAATVAIAVPEEETAATATYRPATAASQPRRSDDGRHIPKKAAMLLGISSGSASDFYAPDPLPQEDSLTLAGVGRRKNGHLPRSATVGGGALSNGGYRPTTACSKRGAAADMATTRLLVEGLTGCIGRLVATLKMPAGRYGEEEPVLTAEGPREVDALFLNALCEIVRCCEDMA